MQRIIYANHYTVLPPKKFLDILESLKYYATMKNTTKYSVLHNFSSIYFFMYFYCIYLSAFLTFWILIADCPPLKINIEKNYQKSFIKYINIFLLSAIPYFPRLANSAAEGLDSKPEIYKNLHCVPFSGLNKRIIIRG
jgi:hypothetical protein